MKKKALVLAICLAISAPAMGLGKSLPNDIGFNLGDIQSFSTVGQRFSGVIPVLFSSVEEARQLRIKIAPDSVFQKIGIDRLPFLDDLQFKVTSKNNRPIIHISSSKPIELPFLDFAIEVMSPKGVVYQDYTILIDPPNYYSSQVISAVASPAVNIAPASVKAHVNSEVRTASKSQLVRGKMINYEVLEGDKLADIAAALKTSKNSLKRMIDIIHRTNPKAFVNNDIKRLKSGVFLKIPSANQISNFKFENINKTKILASKAQKKKHLTATKINKNKATVTRYIVKKGDTLSQITQQFRQKNISFTKQMHDIFEANPHAFSENKINILKAGAKLIIPFATETVAGVEKEFLPNSFEKEFNIDIEPSNYQTATTGKVIRTTDKVASSSIPAGRRATRTPAAQVDSIEVSTTSSDSARVNSKETISNLEKRVRELRNSLKESRSKLSRLETLLVIKNSELQKKSDVIASQKVKMLDLEEKLFEKDELADIDKAAGESIDGLTDLNKSTSGPSGLEPFSVLENEMPNGETFTSEVKSGIFKENVMESLKELSFDNLSLGFLALLLGLGLITYRKELYTYAVASGDYPNYYPSGEESETSLAFEKHEEPEIELTTRQNDDVIISDDELRECDKLINELSDNLNPKDTMDSENNEEWSNLEKICDDYIEKFKEEKKLDKILDIKINSVANKTTITQDESNVTFEDMVTDLISNLDEKSKFAEIDTEKDDDLIHDFGILIDPKKYKNEKIELI